MIRLYSINGEKRNWTTDPRYHSKKECLAALEKANRLLKQLGLERLVCATNGEELFYPEKKAIKLKRFTAWK